MSGNELLEWVKEELIYKRLSLGDMGILPEEVDDTTLLFDEGGLSLDSIEGLELAVGIEQKFGVKVAALNEAVARDKFATPLSIRDYILELLETKKLSVSHST